MIRVSVCAPKVSVSLTARDGMGQESTISADGIRIAKIKGTETDFAEMKTDKYFNTHLILSSQSKLIENKSLRLIRYCVVSPSPPDAPSDHGESSVDAL